MATATYEYKVRDRSGSMKTGKLEADSPTQVAAKLKQMGYAPVSITQANTGMNKELKIPGMGAPKVKLKDLAVFSRQFATMVNSGLSLLRALNILTEQTENKELARVLGAVGGGFAGNEVEKRVRQTTHYAVRVRMDDGSVRTVEQTQAVAVGSPVLVQNGTVRPRGGATAWNG